MKKVYWKEFGSTEYLCDHISWYNKYEGEIIGTNKGFFGTYLVVACSDKKIREVEISKVTYR